MSLNPLAQIDFITMGAIVVIFLVTLFLLRRIAFVPVITVMEQRSARIDAARARKAEADRLLHQAHEESDAALAAAKTEAERIAEQSKQEAAQRRSEALAKASAEAERILNAGRDEVQALRISEQAALRTELQSCVADTLRKMLGSVDDAAVRLTVSRVLESTEAR